MGGAGRHGASRRGQETSAERSPVMVGASGCMERVRDGRWRSGEQRQACLQRQGVDGVSSADRVDGISNTVHPLGQFQPSDG